MSRFDQAAGAADAKAPTPTGKHMLMSDTESAASTIGSLGLDRGLGGIKMHSGLGCPVSLHNEQYQGRRFENGLTMDQLSARTTAFFWDVPWGHVPSNRLANITVEPAYKGGLLGGSSKLAALAAKRKQKQQEEAAKGDVANGETTDKAVALLDRLQIKEKPTSASPREDAKFRYPKKRPVTPPPAAPEPVAEPDPEPEQPRFEFPNLRAKKPSMFGAILCGDAKLEEPEHQPVERALSAFPLPYAHTKAFQDADPFSKPSPDDLVRQAQARSAGAGR